MYNQYGQYQGGQQYPMQPQATGFNPQYQGQFQQGQQGQFQQPGQYGQQQGQFGQRIMPQMTGFAPGGLQSQPTGYGYGMQQQQRPSFQNAPSLPPAPPPPALPPSAPSQMSAPPPIPPQMQQQQQQNFGSRLTPQPMYNQPTGYSAGFSPQPTGFSPQPTGLLRSSPSYGPAGGFSAGVPMQMPSLFTSVFMPANPTVPMGPGQNMQFSMPSQLGGQSLQQAFQQTNVQEHGQAELKVPWALSAEERKNYDQIFRAWDQQGTGFISGSMAREVFGQSGIERDDLMKIWNLADVENRGKLNLAEFHVAMGLIYRRINGNPIPDSLPQELVPPSQRDLGTSVDFVKDLLRTDTVQRATGSPISSASQSYDDEELNYRRAKSLHEPHRPGPPRKDATAYRHNDEEEPKTYKPSSRHIDRRAVRSRAGNDSPNSDLDEMRRELDRSQGALDGGKTRDDAEDELREEKDDLMHRIRQLQADIEHNTSGRRTEAKEAERRRLDRELDRLRYEKLPELERKIEANKREADQRRREAARKRDARNNASRFDDDRDRDRYSSYDDDRDRRRDDDRSYRRNDDRRGSTYEDDERDRRDRRSRDATPPRRASPPRRPASPPRRDEAKSALPPPPPPPPAQNSAAAAAAPPAAPPAPPAAPAAPSGPKPLSAMTPEERKEHIRAEAAKRVQMAMAKFGMPSGASTTVDPTVESRLEQDRQEAEARRTQADQEAAERERQRQVRLEEEKLRDIRKQEANLRQADAQLQQVNDAVTAAAVSQPNSSPEASEGVRAEVDRAASQLHDQEVKLQKEKEAREERIRRLQAEIEEAKRVEEEQEANFKRNKEMFASKSAPAPPASRGPRGAPPAPPPSRGVAKMPAVQSAAAVATSPKAPSPPPAPTPPAQPLNVPEPTPAAALTSSRGPSPSGASTNPFHRMQQSSAPAAPPAPAFNPFGRPQAAPTPAPPKAAVPPPPSEDWDVGSKASEASDASDDDDAPATRAGRAGLANALFGNIMPPISRPSSAQAAGNRSAPQSPATPVAPPAPRAPPAVSQAPASPVSPDANRGALLSQIQGGKSLRKAVTNDRSGSAVAGSVVGGLDPPTPSSAIASSPGEYEAPGMPSRDQDTSSRLSRSVNGTNASALTSHVEENEDEPEPTFKAGASASSAGMPPNVDLSETLQAFSLYPYSNTADPEHIAFPEDVVLEAHRATDNSDWLYGKVASSGASGWFPATYVQIYRAVKARAAYAYEAGSAIELSLVEGQTYNVVEQSDSGWWKVERDGRVGNVPAAYLEVEGASAGLSNSASASAPAPAATPTLSEPDHDDDSSDEEREDDKPLSTAEIEERNIERQKVLEAAGFFLQPQQPARAARRAPPPRPANRSRTDSTASITPAVAEEAEAVEPPPLDDAYERYVKLQRDITQRPRLRSSTSASSTTPPPVAASKSDSPSHASRPSSSALQQSASSLLSWVSSGLSRSSGSSPAPQKSALSSPIIVQHSPTQSATPTSLGKSWASLIDASALEAIPVEERKRQESIFELIQTEATYLNSLQQLVGVFFVQLQPVLPERAAEIIFSNIDSMTFKNTTFLSDLEERQRESRLLIDRIGDVVLRFFSRENLDLYRVYCANQTNAAETLKELKESNPQIASMLQTTRVDGLELAHFLLQPMQRLARYPLLLNQILHYTHEDADDREDLRKAVGLAEQALAATNEAIRQQENDAKLRYLSAKVVFPGTTTTVNLQAPSRLLGKRVLLREGVVTKSRSTKRLGCYLFNDLVLLTLQSGEQEQVYKDLMPLEELVLKPGRDDMSITLAYHGSALKLNVGSARHCQQWQNDIRKAQEQVLAAMKDKRGMY